MKFRTLDDYYNWTCDWCDSENRTLWVKVANGDVRCGACHRVNSYPSSTISPGGFDRLMTGLC